MSFGPGVHHLGSFADAGHVYVHMRNGTIGEQVGGTSWAWGFGKPPGGVVPLEDGGFASLGD